MPGWGGGWRGSCQRIPQTTAECLFFHFFFLKNSSCSSLPLHTRAWSLTQPTSPTRPGTIQVKAHHDPTLNSFQPATTVSVGAHSLCVFATLSSFPSLRLQATRSFPVLLKPCLAGEGAIDLALSPEPYDRPGGCWTWGCSHPGPRAGPRNLIVLKHSPYHLIFQCILPFSISNFHIHWGTVGCSLCSSEDQLGVSLVCRGKWTSLPPILLPSSGSLTLIIHS